MKTAKRRVLSFIMAMLTVITTVFGHVDYNVKAETTTTYTKVSSVSEITAGGQMVLVAEFGESYYALGTTIAGKITAHEVSVSAEGVVTGETLPVWTVASCDTGISLSNGTSFLSYASSTNFTSATGAYAWNVSTSGNGFQIVASGATSRAIALQNGTSGIRFGAYATSNASKTSEYAFDILVFKAPGSGNTGDDTGSTEPSETPELTVSTVAEALAGAEGTKFMVTGVVTLVDGSNIYVQDATGAICVRMSATPSDIALGDTIIGTGSKTTYNGLPQLGSGTYEKSEGLTLSAKTTTLSALTTEDLCTYVEIKGLEVTEVYDNNGGWSTPNITVTDGAKTVQLYKAVVGKTDGTNWDVQVGDTIDVKVALSCNNDTWRLRNTLASEITVVEKASAGDNTEDSTEGGDVTTYNTVAEALVATSGEFTVKGVVTLVDGSNIYVQDATGAICVRMSATPSDIALGDTIIGTGSKTTYNGLPQLGSGTYEKSEGLTLSAKTTTLSALTTEDLCTYVEIKGLEVTEVYDNNGGWSTPNITVTDGAKTVQLYKAVVSKTDGTNWDVQVGDIIDVCAAVSCNNDEFRLRNTLASEITSAKSYDKISAALAAADGETFTVKGVVTLVDGKNIYIQDVTGGICLYMSTTPSDISLGDTITGTGTKGTFKGMPQLSSATYEKSEGMTLSAKKTTIGALTNADLGTYVELSRLEVTEVYDNNGAWSSPNLTLTDGSATIQIYKAVINKTDGTNWDIKVGDKINVKAAVGTNNGTLQLRTTLISEITEAPATISDALAAADGETFTLTGVVTLVDGKNIYIQDATGGICLYMSTTPSDILLGDTITGTGTKGAFKGMPQLSSATYVKSEGMTLSAKKTTIGALTTADLGTYVKLTGLEVTEVYDNNGGWSTPNLTLTDGNATIQIYKAVINKTDGTNWDIKVGDKVDVKATVGCNNAILQLRNTLAAEITPAIELGKITSAADLTTGTYTMVLETGYAPAVVENGWITVTTPTVVGNLVTNHKNAIWTLTVEGTTVILTDVNGVSIAPLENGKNGFTTGEYGWTFEFDETNGTFSFHGVGNGTAYTLASNMDSENKIRPYKDTTVNGTYAAKYPCEFTLYRVDPDAEPGEDDTLVEGSKVVLYNVSAEGVLAAQNDNTDSPAINGVPATVTDGIATVANGGVIFEIQKNGDYYRFYNETYGYLASNGTGNNAFYTKEASDDVDWKLKELGGGFQMESRTAKYNGQYSQYLEYYADSYKTYSMYNVTDYDIYEFHFLPYANEKVTGGIVNEPVAVTEKILDAYVGADYTFTFEVDAPFGVKELTVTVNGEEISYTEAAGVYTIVVPAAKVVGETLVIAVSGKDTVGEAITGTFNVTVKDEPGIVNVTPAAGSQTGNDKKPVISAEITNAGENATVVLTINNKEVAATYADGKVTYTSATDMEDGRYSVTVTVTRADKKTVTKTWAFTVGKAAYQLYFGQLHSHTTYSDGSGSLESALDYIASLPESANVDFVAFTDHSNYFDKSGSANPEGALYDMSLASADSQALWNEYKGTVAEFNASQTDVVALAGFEMTWSGGPGHINTFNTPGIVSRNNTTLNNKTSDAGMKAYYALLSQAEGAESLSQFNHPGSTFGTFTDFSYWDALIDTRIQTVEVGNGEGQIGAGGYYPSYEYYTMALDKGWHVSPTNNQDNHKGKWGNANDARDVVLTDDFTEEGIYAAICAMRMYATEDKNLEIYYTANGFQLGSIIEEVPETLAINVSLFDPDATDSISKVEVIVNSGKTAYTWDDPAVLATGDLSCELDPKYSYYYIRVTQGDGDLAVTSPVWVGETLRLGISSVECGTSTPVTGEEVTITTTMFNSESTDAKLKTLTYTVNGSQVIGTDKAGYTIAASGTKAIDFKFTPADAKLTKITVTAIVEQDGVEYTFTMDVTLDVQDAEKLAYIGIDAAHYNEYVAGHYSDYMGNFAELAADYSVRTVKLENSADLIAACSNGKYKALLLTAPSRRFEKGTPDPKSYTEEEIAAIAKFNENGGIVIFAGWSDHYEDYPVIQDNDAVKHMSETQNEVLAALGSSLRISDDATYDDTYNSGKENYRLYFNTYGDNALTEGVEVDPENPHNRLYTEVFSYYGGASIYVVDETGTPTSKLPATVSPVVYGHSTTYSIDTDKDGKGGDATPKYAYASGDNRIMVMAMEEVEGKGAIIVAGAAFMSNYEVKAEIEDSGSEKNYANYKISENLVQYINPVTITPIAEVQAQTEVGYKYTIEGVVTSNASGYDKDTAFFDCIYVQDETGGVCCFPVAGNYKIGDKVRVTGTTEFYQGEMELQVTDIEVIASGTVSAKTVKASQVNDLSVLGQLIKVSGTVVSFEMANGLVQTIMVKDADGNVVRVFIDGYITTGSDVKNLKVGNKITVTGIASYDDTFNAPDGPFPRIRVRDRADVVCKAASTGGSTSGGTTVTPDEEAPSTETTTPGTENATPSTTPETEGTESTESTEIVESTPVEVVIPTNGTVAEQTEAIVEAIEEVKEGNDVVIKVEDTESKEVVVSVEVLTTLKENEEKDVDLVIELGNGFTWTIEASSVDESKWEAGLNAINFWVEVVEEVVPENLVTEVAKNKENAVEISLKHNGEFGFEAALDIPVGKQHAGKNATLYYFNPESNALEAQELSTVGEDGNVRYTFTHASDYVVVVEETEEVPSTEQMESTEKAENAVTDDAKESKSAAPVIVIILVVLLAAIAGFVFYAKKNKKN